MKTALITGITGQDGSYLAELLLKKGYTVYGLNRKKAASELENLQNVLCREKFHIVEGDLLEESRLNMILRDITPDEIYNLAAQSFVPYSWTNPIYTCDVNALGVARLLEAVRLYSPHSRFYQASSSEMFGKIQKSPQNEHTYHYPRSPYGCSKSFGFNIARNYRESYDLFVCNGICFNHESERRGLHFVTRKITHAVARIAAGTLEHLMLGNMNSRRDWGYAPDYVRAMWQMMQHEVSDDYVIATGKEHTIREFAELAFEAAGMEVTWKGTGVDEKGLVDGKARIVISEDYYRPAEVDVLQGDASKAHTVLGWSPQTTFEEMIRKMVVHDLDLVGKKSESDPVKIR